MPRILFLLLLAGLTPTLHADPPDPEVMGGHVQATIDGETVVFPVLRTDIVADIQGDLASVAVTQTFANPGNHPLHATYLFPLNRQAAVHEMWMRVGEEEIRAQIQTVEQATATFEKAKKTGKSAALLTQHRPNMFTQDIAHLMPGLPIEVTLRYVQPVPRVDGDYQLVVPLVVGPRFQPPGPPRDDLDPRPAPDAGGGVSHWQLDNPPPVAGTTQPVDSQTQFGQWELQTLPVYPPVAGLTVPGQILSERVSIQVNLDAGMPIQAVESPSHPLDAEVLESGRWSVRLAGGATLDNRDFELHYRLAGATPQVGLSAYRDQQGGYFSLLLEPPAAPAAETITPREMVFLLDCSGSMAGLPMEASKAFMRRALQRLRPSDSFRIIRFSDQATEFSSRPLPADPVNIRQGLAYVDGLRGSGGTVMSEGIRQALTVPAQPGTLRLVVFLTDGYIGNESEILRLVVQERDSARLFSFGVGSGVNRYLLAELARVGRGFFRTLDPTQETPEEVVTALAKRLETPVLTDIRIDWGGLQASDLSPAVLPDLFAGDSLRLLGRYQTPGEYQITVHGKINGQAARLPLQLTLPEESTQGQGVALSWARATIADAMHALITPPGLRAEDDQSLKQRVIELGLAHSLVTRWTAFVAVSQQIYNPEPGNATTRPVPLPQVAGVKAGAYGDFGGASTPEPGLLVGLGVVAASLLGARRRRRSIGGFSAVNVTTGG